MFIPGWCGWTSQTLIGRKLRALFDDCQSYGHLADPRNMRLYITGFCTLRSWRAVLNAIRPNLPAFPVIRRWNAILIQDQAHRVDRVDLPSQTGIAQPGKSAG